MSKKYIESPLTAGWSRRDSIVILAQGKHEKMGKNGDGFIFELNPLIDLSPFPKTAECPTDKPALVTTSHPIINPSPFLPVKSNSGLRIYSEELTRYFCRYLRKIIH